MTIFKDVKIKAIIIILCKMQTGKFPVSGVANSTDFKSNIVKSSSSVDLDYVKLAAHLL